MEKAKQHRRAENGEPFAIGPQGVQHQTPEQDFLGQRSENTHIQEHTQTARLPGYPLQGFHHRQAEGAHNPLQQRDPEAVDDLGADTERQQSRQSPRRHGFLPPGKQPLEEFRSLPAVEDHRPHPDGGQVPPAVIHGRRRSPVSAPGQRQQSLPGQIQGKRHNHQQIHDAVVAQQRPAHPGEPAAQHFIDLFFFHRLPPAPLRR